MIGMRRHDRGSPVMLVAIGAAILMATQGAFAAPTHAVPVTSASVSPALQAQVAAINAEKRTRTPAQRKIDSQLLYQEKVARHVSLPANFPKLRTGIPVDGQGMVAVDVTGRMTPVLLQSVQAAGGKVTVQASDAKSLQVRMPLVKIEELAASSDVTFIEPHQAPHLATGSVDSEGDTTHGALTARSTFSVDGTGVKIGVLSDGIASLATSQASGDLGTVTVLPGQAGPADGDEGTAMLEVVHDLAPGAQLYFATAFTSEASFAQNIRDLRSAGCDIIVDDVSYYDESPFQDGPIAQAVNDVTAAGALYFSSAGNSGNLDDGTSGVWESDFRPYTDSGGNVWADFNAGSGIQLENPIGATSIPVLATLQWADPYGGSANDYDFYLIDSSGTTIVGSSTNVQTGTQDPYESIVVPAGYSDRRVAVLRYSDAAAPRFMHLSLNGGYFTAGGTGLSAYATAGQTSGHSAAADAFSVAATPAHTSFGAGQPAGPYPGLFTSSNVSETFTSDGPRRMFYAANGTAYTPGNFTSTGGVVRSKPDITAADGVATTVPGFQPFFGTSAAAPHAAAIAALVLAARPGITPAQVRRAMTSSTIDIEALGWDRDTGAGIIDANAAVKYVRTDPMFTPLPPARILDTRTGNGAPKAAVGSGKSINLQVTGRGGVPGSGIGGVVVNVTVTQPTGSGFVTAYPAGTSRPSASNLNFVSGQTVPNLVAVKVGARGMITLFNGSSGSVHLIADVAGYYAAGLPGAAGSYDALSPYRILDTRSGNGAPKAAVGSGQTITLQVSGRGGVPASGAGAVKVNVTVTQPTAGGFITVYPDGAAQPNASNLNFVRGQTVPNLVAVKLGTNGQIRLYNGSSGTVQLIADVAGYFVSGSPTVAGAFGPLTPARILDTRTGNGAPKAPVGSGQTITLQVSGRGGVPGSGAGALIVNVTVTQPTGSGFITVYPNGATQPNASNLNFVRGLTVPNLVAVKLGTNGQIRLYNGSSGTVQLIADVAGYYLAT